MLFAVNFIFETITRYTVIKFQKRIAEPDTDAHELRVMWASPSLPYQITANRCIKRSSEFSPNNVDHQCPCSPTDAVNLWTRSAARTDEFLIPTTRTEWKDMNLASLTVPWASSRSPAAAGRKSLPIQIRHHGHRNHQLPSETCAWLLEGVECMQPQSA